MINNWIVNGKEEKINSKNTLKNLIMVMAMDMKNYLI